MKNSFRVWIEAHTAPRIAKVLKLNASTVYYWMSGARAPSPKLMQKLVKMGKGAFSYNDIINLYKKEKRGKT